jgi:hypothetical protein
MLGEYGVLLNHSGFMSMLNQLPRAIVNFLRTQDGQIAVGVLLVVMIFLSLRRR